MTNDTTDESNLTCLLALFADIAASELKNDDILMKVFAQAQTDASKLEDENDKLRELVWDMWFYITEPSSLVERFARFDDISSRIHELGWRGY